MIMQRSCSSITRHVRSYQSAVIVHQNRANLHSYRRILLVNNKQGLSCQQTGGARKKAQSYYRYKSTDAGKNTPEEPTNVVPKSLAIGAFAGVCGSLAGMGGGFVMIPLMTSSLLRLSQHQAHGTSLFAVASTGIAGALGYSGHVQWEAAAAIACCGMFSASFGASVSSRLSEKSLKKALGYFMLFVAPLVPAKGFLMQQQQQQQQQNEKELEKEKSMVARIVPPALIGTCSGFLAGLFGVGGGAVVVPALTLFADVTHYQALGTSLCAMTVPAIAGTLTHYQKGNVAMRVAPALALGAFCGGYFGGKLGLQTNENALRWGFSGLMTFLGLRTIMKV